jgi:hypothetical protein
MGRLLILCDYLKLLESMHDSSLISSTDFFDDSVRNIASGKVAGFNTVIVRYTP